MPRVIAFDLTRLFLGPLFLAPRGIDRVDLALARHVFAEADAPHLGILPTPWGMRAYPAWLVRRVLDHVEALWAERAGEDPDPQIAALIAAVQMPVLARLRPPGPQRSLSLWNKIARIVGELRATGLHWGRPAARAVPRGAIYLNVGQLGLAVPPFFNWLAARRDITVALMLHDVIPLEYPELVRHGHADHHARMIRTAVRHADCLIFATAHARDTVGAAMARMGRTGLPALVRTLPLPAAFRDVRESLPGLGGCHYFVVVSTIELRKNHALLLRVWRRLIATQGRAAPHLVMVGARGFDADRVLAPIDHDPQLRLHVHEVAGLSSPALASLVLGASGLLSPSQAEGFGLPVLEANLLGVPTIASDIAAHREVANGSTILLPGDDEAAWERAILAHGPAAPRCAPQIPPAAGERAYCDDVVAFANRIAANIVAIK